MITSDEGDGGTQPLWLSDTQASAELWARLLAEHSTSGLWPLHLDSLDPDDSEFRPWASGELFPEDLTAPQEHDPAVLLAQWWGEYTKVGEDGDLLTPDKRLALTQPFGQTWPRPALDHEPVTGAGQSAAEYAQTFADQHPQSRLRLVAAACGADALTAVGWDGPTNYDVGRWTYLRIARRAGSRPG
ncbi:hypothetical protein [Streptomyces sp. NPDC087538]|uniref:hypothetical protein n=1 Tax=Streptomyces sp. NPDC087538 TaxID=3365797 RepID=UPI00381C5F82